MTNWPIKILVISRCCCGFVQQLVFATLDQILFMDDALLLLLAMTHVWFSERKYTFNRRNEKANKKKMYT